MIVVAGPCSAESAGQVLASAEALKGHADLLRAGLWKPRTLPGTFEGVGEAGLRWLLDARRATGIPVCTEVLGATHVRLCADAGIDAVWLGARTTANPYLVQEIAEALRGTSLKVMVKNPVSPDLGLWKGAAGRLMAAGVKDIILVHRGFTPVGDSVYRNDPRWGVAISMRTAYPSLPMLCDPSHMGGSAALVPEISRCAMDLGYDGLMVECHPAPAEACSDAAQQLSPDDFVRMIAGLRPREVPDDAAFDTRVGWLRAQIDEIDRDIVGALARRMRVSEEIGRLKRESSVPVIQPSRWDEVLSRVKSEASRLGMDPEIAESIYGVIHEASVLSQR